MKILVTDDEEVIRLFIARVLDDKGLTCDFAEHGVECIERFKESGGYDVLFLDLVMPHMDGEKVLREIHVTHPKTLVVMCSVQDDEEAIKELLEEGATAYLTKPISAANLADVVDRLVELHEEIKSQTAE